MAVLNPSQINIKAMIEAEASRQGVDPALATAIGYAESGYNPRATSPAGAQGVMQLIPGTATRFQVRDAYDPAENIRGGVAYLKHLSTLFPDNPDFQIAAYHAGEGAVQKARGIPRTSDGLSTTAQYVQRVRGIMGRKGTPSLDEEMALEIARARAQVQDDVSPIYLASKNAQIDAAFQRDLAQIRAAQAPEATPSPTAEQLAAPAIAVTQQPIVAYQYDRAFTEPQAAGIPVREVVSRLGEDALQVLGGARDAFVQTMQTLNLLGDWLRENGIGPRGTLQIRVPEVREADTVEGPLIRSASQFLTAFLPATKLVQGLGVVGQVSSGLAAGALADFAAFDPEKPRVSNLINDLVPALKNPITTYLAATPTDSEAEGRLKNALEGLGLGVLTNGLFLAVRTLRETRRLGRDLERGFSQGLSEGARDVTQGTATTAGRQLATLTEEEIQRAVGDELAQATARHAASLDAARTTLQTVQAGDAGTIQNVLASARNVLQAEDGTVAVGRGGTMHRFDTPQDAATFLLERRITRLQETEPYQPLNALKRALGDAPEAQRAIPGDAVERFAAPPPTPTATLVDAATVPDVLPYQSMQISGAADVLPKTGKTAHVNFARIQTSDDVKQVIATVADLTRAEAEAQRRGTRTVAETLAASQESPYRELDRILGITPGTALNAEDATAVRQVWVSAADRLHRVAQHAATGDRQAYEEFLKMYVITSNVHTVATGVRAEAGRTLQAFGIQLPAVERQWLQQLSAVLEEATGLAPDVLAARVAALPSKEQLAKFLVDTSAVTRADMFTELWYGALLSNPATHMVNALDGALRTAWAVPERYLSVALSGSNGVSLGEANAALYGLRQSLGEAWSYAAKAFRTGESAFGHATKVEAAPRAAITAANAGLELDQTLLGGFVDLLGRLFRSPGRALLSADEFFKVVNYRSELHAQAYRRAMQEGLHGEDLARRIVALVEQPLESLKDTATAFANYQTLAQPLTQEGAAFEALGRVAQHLVDAREDWLPLKVIVPFVRTPFNVARAAAERTPLGLLSSNMRRALVAEGAEGALARSKMALGSLTLGLFGWLAVEGVITGKAPSDPGLRDTWQRLGIQEYSLKLGDTYYSYNRFDLFGLPMGLMADFTAIAREAPVQRLETMAGAIMGAIFQNLTSKTYLKGLAEVIEAMTPGQGDTETQQGQQFERYLTRLAGSLVPAGVAAVARTLDPVQHEARTMVDTLLSRLPGYSEDVPARLDLYGRPRLNAEPVGPDLLSPVASREYQPDRVDEELLRQRVPLRMPERVIRLQQADRAESEPVELTPQQYKRYVELSAGYGLTGAIPLKQALQQAMDSPAYQSLSDGPNGGKSVLLRQIVSQYREAAKGVLQGEDPQLQQLFTVQRAQRSLNQTTQGQTSLRNLRIGVPQ